MATDPDYVVIPTVTSSVKWWLAILLGALFFFLAFSPAYNFSRTIWTKVSGKQIAGCPNNWIILVHAIIYGLIIRLVLW